MLATSCGWDKHPSRFQGFLRKNSSTSVSVVYKSSDYSFDISIMLYVTPQHLINPVTSEKKNICDYNSPDALPQASC